MDGYPIECPDCGALSSEDDIDHRAFDITSERLELECKCLVCGHRFVKYYYSASDGMPKMANLWEKDDPVYRENSGWIMSDDLPKELLKDKYVVFKLEDLIDAFYEIEDKYLEINLNEKLISISDCGIRISPETLGKVIEGGNNDK